MYYFQCMNPDCFETGIGYIFESKFPVCPKCGNKPPHVGTAVVMHFLYFHDKGTFRGYMNRKLSIACGANQVPTPYSASTLEMSLVTCPKCRQSEVFKAAWRPKPDDPMSYFQDPNLTDEEREQLLKSME